MHSHGPLHHLAHDYDRAFEVEALTRMHVQLQRDSIQLFLSVYRQVGAFGQILANQAFNVFVAAALPRAVRVAEKDRHTGSLGALGVPWHFPAWIVGHALARRQRHAIECCTAALHSRGRRRVEHQVATGALHQRAYRRVGSLALDQVVFSMPRHQPVFDLRRAQVNADHLRELAALAHAARSRSTCRLALAQAKVSALRGSPRGRG